MTTDSLFHYKDVLIVLGTAGLVIPVLLRFGVNSILGFLVVGLFLGPHVSGRLAEVFPALPTLALSESDGLAGMAELGVVFLLFLIGLELSPERLRTMRRLVFGFGGLQVVLSSLALFVLAKLASYATVESLVIAVALALSSTAIVIQLFSDEKRLGSQAGRISFAVLLMQDLAVIPILLLVGAIANPEQANLASSVGLALAQAAGAALLIVMVGRYALTPLLRLVAATKSADLFMASVLFIAVGTGAVAMLAGLSMSLGAFIAGLMLAETEYRRAIEVIIEPFKGLLLGLFFLLVGLGLNLDLLLQQPLVIVGTAIAVIATKALIIFALSIAFKLPRPAGLEAALVLGPCGEFAFVVIATATAAGMFANNGDAQILLLVTLTMMAIPFLAKAAKSLRARFFNRSQPLAKEMERLPEKPEAQVIIAGFGRVGSLVASMLDEQSVTYLAIDQDVGAVTTARKTNTKVFYGDATNIDFLRACGLDHAKALAITMDSPARVDDILRVARLERPDLKIIARARDERHAMRLYQQGVTEAVPETIEASLQLGEAILVEAGVPMGLAIASVHERRDGFRKLLGRPNRRAEVAAARRRLRDRMQT